MSPGAPRAQECPARPVTLIVPFAAGGTIDIGLRALAAATEKHLGQSIVGENRTGAGGLLGPAQMATSSKPDGYTQRHSSRFLERRVCFGLHRISNWVSCSKIQVLACK